MAGKTVKQIESYLYDRVKNWIESLKLDGANKIKISDSVFVAGGAIASMLLGEEPNDIDIYFTDKSVAKLVLHYYTKDQFSPDDIIETVSGVKIDGKFGVLKPLAKPTKDGSVECFTECAISLNNDIQIITKFVGSPGEVVDKFDFVHCKNYYVYYTGQLTTNPQSLMSLLTKELVYDGSDYPVSAMFRTRKFIKRGWNINAGTMLKVAFDISKLDLTNLSVLKNQLVGVDVLYFLDVLALIEEKSKTETGEIVVDRTMLFDMLDQIFG